MLKYKWLAIIIIISVLTLFPFIYGTALHKDFINYKLIIDILFLQILIIATICLMFLFIKRTTFIDRVISGTGFICLSSIAFITWGFVAELKDNKILYKEKIVGDYYLQYETICEGQQTTTAIILEENPFFVSTRYRTFNNEIDLSARNYPDQIKFLSLNDTFLKFSLIKNNIEKEYVADIRFEYIDREQEGIRVVNSNNKQGAIDSTGKIIIPIIYDQLEGSYRGLLHAQKLTEAGYKTGYIDKTGKVLIPFNFDEGSSFSGDSAIVGLNGKHYYINKKGDIISEYLLYQ